MQINWFEVFAQILNFFILLALLNKFLFKPVMAAMEKREEEIANTIKSAEAKFSEAENLVNEYEVKIKEIRNKEEEIITNAKKEADQKRETLFNQYKEEIKLKKINFENEFNTEKADFIKSFRKFLANYTIRISKKVLEPVSETELENKVFQGLLKTLEKTDKEILAEEKKINRVKVEVNSSAKISEDQKKELSDAIIELLKKENQDISFSFNVDPSLIYGYKIIFNTFTVNENLDFYLKDLEEEVEKNQKF